MTNHRMGLSLVAEAFDALEADLTPGGEPAGLRACARDASVADTESDRNGLTRRERREERRRPPWEPLNDGLDRGWSAAVILWDRIRADIRHLPSEEDEAAAWALAVDALEELQADLAQRFGPEVRRVVGS